MKKNNSVKATDLIVEYSSTDGPVVALNCKQFEAKAGSAVAIMGESGCGKSTLLGVLGGLAVPTSGKIIIGNSDLTSLSESQRGIFRKNKIGLVFQNDNLLPFLTVFENIFLQVLLSSKNKHYRNKIINLLNSLGLEGLENRYPDQLSGGQRQRVAIARAVIHEPEIILADEPTGALDDKNSNNVIELLLDLKKKFNSTLIIVTHDIKVAKKMEKTITLIDGKIKRGSNEI
jgi:putative ABC transport system ATP-binding protein